MCVCVGMCVYVYVCVRTHACVGVHVCVCVHVCLTRPVFRKLVPSQIPYLAGISVGIIDTCIMTLVQPLGREESTMKWCNLQLIRMYMTSTSQCETNSRI